MRQYCQTQNRTKKVKQTKKTLTLISMWPVKVEKTPMHSDLIMIQNNRHFLFDFMEFFRRKSSFIIVRRGLPELHEEFV